ncbi:uncharacterized protein [Solanum lycopersicum]|uniref:uncharacterized protein n=1 Tax=Solanum lycopersicum TaxID=4081 RepID=UPI00374930EA
MRKNMEEVAAISYGGKKVPRNSSRPLDRSKPQPKSYQAFLQQSNHSGDYNSSYREPSPTYQVQDQAYQSPFPSYQAPVPNYQTNTYPRTQAPRPNARNYQQVPPPQQSRFSAAVYIHPVGSKLVDVNFKFYKPEQRCAYHSNSVRHETEDCINLKHKIQDLIDQKVVSLQPAAPNVNTNWFPNHEGGSINMIETDEDECETKRITPVVQEDLEKAVSSLCVKEKGEFVILTPMKAVALKDHAKRPISEAEAEELWRRMQPKDYSIVKHLEKTPCKISMCALLMSSWSHRKALLKALDDTYVPSGTSNDNVADMIHQVIQGHCISLCDDEFPAEGRSHNKYFHVSVICRGKVINRVLVDDGSGLNICPLSTLKQLRFDLGKLEQNQVNVRAFDGVQRDILGAVNLTLQVGFAEFDVKFQVLDIDNSYNILLGRPFIHMAGAVPSTHHQMMKLIWKNEELVVHGERSHSG